MDSTVCSATTVRGIRSILPFSCNPWSGLGVTIHQTQQIGPPASRQESSSIAASVHSPHNDAHKCIKCFHFVPSITPSYYPIFILLLTNKHGIFSIVAFSKHILLLHGQWLQAQPMSKRTMCSRVKLPLISQT